MNAETTSPPRRIEAITFDVTNTLIHCPRLAAIYQEVLDRHGTQASEEELRHLIPTVWQELSCRTEIGRDRFRSHPEGARGWWAGFLGRLCEYLEADPPSPFVAAELFHRFARADSWEIYPEVPGTLEALAEIGVSLAVISNWDDRLGPLLTRLGLTRFFDAIVFSAAIGLEKPDPRIFRYTLDLLEVAPEAAIHVGDSAKEDIEGAVACGMQALLLDRRGGGGDLEDLSSLPERIAVAVG